MQAKDLNSVQVLAVISQLNQKLGHPVDRWALAEAIPKAPPKVIQEKCRRLIKAGLLEGCVCGCRGDFQLVEQEK